MPEDLIKTFNADVAKIILDDTLALDQGLARLENFLSWEEDVQKRFIQSMVGAMYRGNQSAATVQLFYKYMEMGADSVQVQADQVHSSFVEQARIHLKNTRTDRQ